MCITFYNSHTRVMMELDIISKRNRMKVKENKRKNSIENALINKHLFAENEYLLYDFIKE